jgi:hypothetical protein
MTLGWGIAVLIGCFLYILRKGFCIYIARKDAQIFEELELNEEQRT